jgi:transcriptional regulator with XRE-family HTH domain
MSNFLKKIRESKNISQSNLANKIGVTKQLLCGFENGRNGISNEVLQKLATTLDVSQDAILSGKSFDIFDYENKKLLTKALNMTFKYYGEDLDKDTIIKISTELYGILVDFNNQKTQSDIASFNANLEDKIAVGLAAKCFLKNNNREYDR